jgi:hypothetical protein
MNIVLKNNTESEIQENTDISKRNFLLDTGEKTMALAGIHTLAKIGVMGTLGSLLISEEAEAASKQKLLKIGPYNLQVTQFKKTEHRGKTSYLPEKLNESSLQNISIQDINKYFIPWIEEMSTHRNHSVTYQYLFPMFHLLVAQVHINTPEGNKKTARNYLQNAKYLSINNNQYFYYCKTGYYLSKLEFDEYKNITGDDRKYLKKIHHTTEIMSKIKSNQRIVEQEGPKRLNLLFADIEILSGEYLRTILPEPTAAFSDLFEEDEYIENHMKINSYQQTKLRALQTYKKAMNLASIQERPEAYYYAAEILMYFCVNRDNWNKADLIYKKLLPVVTQLNIPQKQKEEWLQTINDNSERIKNSIHKWKKFNIQSPLSPDSNHDLYVADDGAGKIWFQHEMSESDKATNTKYKTMKWFDFPQRANDPNKLESVAKYLQKYE